MSARNVPTHLCPEDGNCPVCSVPRWTVEHAPLHRVEAGYQAELTVTLSGNTVADIREAFDNLTTMMGWSE